MGKYRNIGLKLTPQRMAIFDYLDGNKDHPSAEEIHRAVAMKFPTMSLATVYNTLGTLRELGGLRELAIDPARKRYDPDTGRHNHLICMACKKVVDVQVNVDLKLSKSVRRNFTIMHNQIEFYGFCPDCKGPKGQRPAKEGAHVRRT